jgi:hypothetical protein
MLSYGGEIAEMPSAWFELCLCRRTFSVPQAYTLHQRSCRKSKKRLADALDMAKVLQARKRQKVGVGAAQEIPEEVPVGAVEIYAVAVPVSVCIVIYLLNTSSNWPFVHSH